jgi:hypothetical protein
LDCVKAYVYAVDDCGTCSQAVTVTAVATGCESESPPEHTTSSATVNVKIDDTPPSIGCNIIGYPPSKSGKDGSKVFMDVGFQFSAMSDGCAERLDAKIDVFANEFVNGDEMVVIAIPMESVTPIIFVHDETCKKKNDDKCRTTGVFV